MPTRANKQTWVPHGPSAWALACVVALAVLCADYGRTAAAPVKPPRANLSTRTSRALVVARTWLRAVQRADVARAVQLMSLPFRVSALNPYRTPIFPPRPLTVRSLADARALIHKLNASVVAEDLLAILTPPAPNQVQVKARRLSSGVYEVRFTLEPNYLADGTYFNPTLIVRRTPRGLKVQRVHFEPMSLN